MTRLLLALVALSSLASAVFLGLLLYQQRVQRDEYYRELRVYIGASSRYSELWLRAEGQLDYCRNL